MSSLSVASATSTAQTPWTQPPNPFQQLAQALQSGNLAAAQQAYALIQQNAPQGAAGQTGQTATGQAATTQTGQGNPGQAAFTALGQALSSGNLTAAQQAFSQLQQAGGHHHHHHGGQGGQAAAAATPQASAATTGDTLNITNNSGTINEILGGANSGGGTGAGGDTINITGNTGTINLIA